MTVYIDGVTSRVDPEYTYIEGNLLHIRSLPMECISEPITVNEIRVEGFNYPPIAGTDADESLAGVHLVGDAPYSFFVNDLAWYDVEVDDFFHGSFELGKTYAVFFPVSLPYAYEFADDTAIYINGGTELVSETYVFNFGDVVNFYSIDFIAVEAAPEPGTVYGDLTGEGDITMSDAILACRHLIGLAELTESQLLAADVDVSGDITIEDAILILRRAAGLIDLFPIEE